MNTRKISYGVDVREQRRYERIRRLRRERRRKCVIFTAALAAAFFMIFVCGVSYSTINTHASDGFKYYTDITVEAGESLWEIADEYMDVHYDSRESYIAEVCSINHLSDENDITAGQILIVPYFSSEYVR